MQPCNHLPGQVFVTQLSALDLFSETCLLETESRNDGFSQISGALPCPFKVLRKVKHLEWSCEYIHIR
jgi:hypothetical protein